MSPKGKAAVMLSLAAAAILYAYAAYAGSTIEQVRAFEVTCGSTATRIVPSAYSHAKVASFTCMMSRETPDDSSDCSCVGGSDLDDNTKCYPIGGCSRALNTQITVNGDAYCMREDGVADTVMVCLAGRSGA